MDTDAFEIHDHYSYEIGAPPGMDIIKEITSAIKE